MVALKTPGSANRLANTCWCQSHPPLSPATTAGDDDVFEMHENDVRSNHIKHAVYLEKTKPANFRGNSFVKLQSDT